MRVRSRDRGVAKIDADDDHVMSGKAEGCHQVRPPGGNQAAEPAVDEGPPVDLLEPGVDEADQERRDDVALERVEMEVGQF